MTNKKQFRKRRLFPRALEEVVKDATKPLMSKQGRLYGALLRDWEKIVGRERAAISRPQRLQFPANEAEAAILHLDVRPAAAPEMAYVTEQMLEQCARYFGYRAVDRIVIHATHHQFDRAEEAETSTTPSTLKTHGNIELPPGMPNEVRRALERLATHVAKKN